VDCAANRGVLRLNIVQLDAPFPESFEPSAGRGAGTKIIRALARQIGANLIYSRAPANGSVELICPIRQLH
jgi:two-component sensor histidine kinase